MSTFAQTQRCGSAEPRQPSDDRVPGERSPRRPPDLVIGSATQGSHAGAIPLTTPPASKRTVAGGASPTGLFPRRCSARDVLLGGYGQWRLARLPTPGAAWPAFMLARVTGAWPRVRDRLCPEAQASHRPWTSPVFDDTWTLPVITRTRCSRGRSWVISEVKAVGRRSGQVCWVAIQDWSSSTEQAGRLDHAKRFQATHIPPGARAARSGWCAQPPKR